LHQLSAENKLPCLILLDINMPGMDGRETLIKIKQHEQLKNIPVAMFSTLPAHSISSLPPNGTPGFFTKPLVYDEMEKMVDTFVALCEHNTVPKS
jgi:CheY-like chemotaxis protein